MNRAGCLRIGIVVAAILMSASCSDRVTPPDGGPHTWPLPPLDSLLVVQDWQPACSPDGHIIAYSHEVMPGHESECGTFGICRIEVGHDSVGTPVLVAPISGAYWLSFAPDNRRVVYAWNRDIWVADIFTKEVRRLTTHRNGQKPDWHPHEDIVVYNRIEATESPADSGAIRVLNVDNLDDTPIHTRGGRVLYGGGAAWDPAGESIVFTRYAPGTGGLEVFRAYPDSTEEIQLTDFGWTCELPKWINEGRGIAFRINPPGTRDPDFPDWWVIPETGGLARPFYNSVNQIEVGGNMAVGPGVGEFVMTRPSAGNEHWLSLWVVRFGDDQTMHWRQVTGPP